MHLAVGSLERILDTLNVVDYVKRLDQVDIHYCRVADKSEDRLLFADRLVDIELVAPQPLFETFELTGFGILFEYDDHLLSPPRKKTAPSTCVEEA